MRFPTALTLGADLLAGRTSSMRLTEQALQRIEDAGGEGARAFVKVYADTAMAEARVADVLRASGVRRSPIDGLPVSIKDLFDVAGSVTRAGSIALSDAPPAQADAPAVARLRAAGAVIIGRTNTVEFAFGGVGLNPHYGTPLNPYGRNDGGRGRVPGGSSCGAGVAVADGMCTMGLGSDTRGSVRIPAALCGIAGFKPTAARVPKDGCWPLSYTLDSVGPLCNSIHDCALYDAILSGATCTSAAAPAPLPPSSLRLLMPVGTALFDGLDAQVSTAFESGVAKLRAAGATIDESAQGAPDLVRQTQELFVFGGGGFAGAEAYHVHRELLQKKGHLYDPRVASRIAAGEQFGAADYMQLFRERDARISEAKALLAPYDAMIYPTVACTAPTVEEVSRSDEDYVRWNLLMLRNTGLMNALDGCAATVPCQKEGDAPVGLTVAGMGGSDHRVLAASQAVEAILQQSA